MPFTDVDRLLLERWTEVTALREAFEDLLDRMREPIEIAARRAAGRGRELGFVAEYDLKQPSLDLWKESWANRQGQRGIYLRIADFAPFEYGNIKTDHPWLWVLAKDFGALRIRQADAVPFVKEVRTQLGAEAAKWEDPEVDDSAEPLGRYCTEVSESDRVRWMSNPDELAEFLVKGMQDLVTLAPAIDIALERFRKK